MGDQLSHFSPCLSASRSQYGSPLRFDSSRSSHHSGGLARVRRPHQGGHRFKQLIYQRVWQPQQPTWARHAPGPFGPLSRDTLVPELDEYAEFVTGTQETPVGLDVTTPNVARMYDCHLGGQWAASRSARYSTRVS